MVGGEAKRISGIEAEAAAWLARIQNDGRRDEYADALQDWLAADVAHRDAFAKATQAWELIAGAHQGVVLTEERRAASTWIGRRRRSLHAPAAALVAACVALAVLGGVFLHLRSDRPLHYETAPGEQISIVLNDGSRISLNTRSAVDVDYSKDVRRIALLSGEAMFEVSKDPNRPFIVRSGTREVRALGTTFVVRRDPQRLAVTLIEGHVNVSKLTSTASVTLATLNPGDRLTLDSADRFERDHPQPENVIAWRRGSVVFKDVSLDDAAAEINRYSTRHVVAVAPEVGRLRISGVFGTRDEGEFAIAAATALGLSIRQEGNRIILVSRIVPEELR